MNDIAVVEALQNITIILSGCKWALWIIAINIAIGNLVRSHR